MTREERPSDVEGRERSYREKEELILSNEKATNVMKEEEKRMNTKWPLKRNSSELLTSTSTRREVSSSSEAS